MSKAISASNKMTMWVFFLNFVYVVDYIDGFAYIVPSLHPWDKAYLMMVNYCFDAFFDSAGQSFVEYICINVHKGNWS